MVAFNSNAVAGIKQPEASLIRFQAVRAAFLACGLAAMFWRLDACPDQIINHARADHGVGGSGRGIQWVGDLPRNGYGPFLLSSTYHHKPASPSQNSATYCLPSANTRTDLSFGAVSIGCHFILHPRSIAPPCYMWNCRLAPWHRIIPQD